MAQPDMFNPSSRECYLIGRLSTTGINGPDVLAAACRRFGHMYMWQGRGDCFCCGASWDGEGEAVDDDSCCDGHESLDGAHMGEAVYCDGSCR